jgi:FAD synthase
MGLLSTIEERALLLEREGVDRMVVARFDENFRSQPYDSFVRESLVAKLGMVGMIVGYNHRLGRGSEGNFERLQPVAERCGFVLECVPQQRVDEEKVSSTVVRSIIESGDMQRVKTLLGGDYIICGRADDGVVVVEDTHKLLPPCGEYNVFMNNNAATIIIDNRSIRLSEPISGSVVIRF